MLEILIILVLIIGFSIGFFVANLRIKKYLWKRSCNVKGKNLCNISLSECNLLRNIIEEL